MSPAPLNSIQVRPGIFIPVGQLPGSSNGWYVEVRPGSFIFEGQQASKHLPPVLAELADKMLALISDAHTQQLIQRKRVLVEERSTAILLLRQRMYSDRCRDVVARRLPCDSATRGQGVSKVRATIAKLWGQAARCDQLVQQMQRELEGLLDSLGKVGQPAPIYGSIAKGEFPKAKLFYEKQVEVYERETERSAKGQREHELYTSYWQAEAELQHHIIHNLCSASQTGGMRADKAKLSFRLHLAKHYEQLSELNSGIADTFREELAVERGLLGIYKKVKQLLAVTVRLQAEMGDGGGVAGN